VSAAIWVWSAYPYRISSTYTLTTVNQYVPPMSSAKLAQRRMACVTTKRIWRLVGGSGTVWTAVWGRSLSHHKLGILVSAEVNAKESAQASLNVLFSSDIFLFLHFSILGLPGVESLDKEEEVLCACGPGAILRSDFWGGSAPRKKLTSVLDKEL